MNDELFELNPTEIIITSEGLTHYVRKPSDQEWFDYDRLCLPMQMTKAEQLEFSAHEIKAYEHVYDAIVLRCAGLESSNAENWKTLVPSLEKRKVVRLFSQVQAIDLDEGEGADLTAFAPGNARWFVKLLAGLGQQLYYIYYAFPAITAGQLNEYDKRAQQWTTKLQGSKLLMNRELTVKRLATFCRELVLWTCGYSLNGNERMEDVPDWRQYLDALHCKVAVDRLFQDVREDIEATLPKFNPLSLRRQKAATSAMNVTQDN